MSKRVGRPKIPKNEHVKYNDKIVCDVCNGTYTRSNKAAHNKTNLHRRFEKINKDIRTLVNTEDEPYRGGIMSVSTFKKKMAADRIKKKINEMQDENSDTESESDDQMSENSDSEDEYINEISNVKNANLRLKLENNSLKLDNKGIQEGINNLITIINYINEKYGDVQLSISELSNLIDNRNTLNNRIRYIDEILSQ